MAVSNNFLSINKKQYIIFLLLVTGIVGLTGILSYANPHIFDRFFGTHNPLLICFVIAAAGLLCLSFLLYKSWFKIYEKNNVANEIRLVGFVAIFVSISILIDIKIHFPIDMNIAFPASLLFYPAIGFLVEILFHVFPITLLLFSLTSFFKNINIKKTILVSIIVTATLEPIYQTLYMANYPAWAVISVWINLYLFNLAQLIIFKRFGFMPMFACRLIFYLIWHVVWGYVRISILF